LFTEKLEQLFADLVKHTGDVPVSTEELIQIKKALGMQASKWYRCSKGEWAVNRIRIWKIESIYLPKPHNARDNGNLTSPLIDRPPISDMPKDSPE
jgi:hypothetical protein